MDLLKKTFSAAMARAQFAQRFKDDCNYIDIKQPGDASYTNFRVSVTEEGVDFVSGINDHTEPNVKIKRDYTPAREYMNFINKFDSGSMAPMPAIGPYRPTGFSQNSSTQLVRRVESNIIIKLKLRLSPEQKIKHRHDVTIVNDGVLGYNGFISSVEDALPSTVSLVFNPFSLQGARMVTSITESTAAFYGSYKFGGVDYKFHWPKETDKFIVNSDVWSCYINCSYDLVRAFSIASDVDFWSLGFNRKNHQPCALIGIVPVNDLDSPYDISNVLKRRDEDSSNFMRFGSASVIKIKKKKYVRAEKVRTANFSPDIDGSWNFYEGKKKNKYYVIKEEKMLMHRPSTVIGSKFISYKESPGSCYTIFKIMNEEVAVRSTTRGFFSTRIYQVADGYYYGLEGDDPPLDFEEFYNNPMFQRKFLNDHGSVGMMNCVELIYQISKMPITEYIRLWLQEYDDFSLEIVDDAVVPDETHDADWGEIYL